MSCGSPRNGARSLPMTNVPSQRTNRRSITSPITLIAQRCASCRPRRREDRLPHHRLRRCGSIRNEIEAGLHARSYAQASTNQARPTVFGTDIRTSIPYAGLGKSGWQRTPTKPTIPCHLSDRFGLLARCSIVPWADRHGRSETADRVPELIRAVALGYDYAVASPWRCGRHTVRPSWRSPRSRSPMCSRVSRCCIASGIRRGTGETRVLVRRFRHASGLSTFFREKGTSRRRTSSAGCHRLNATSIALMLDAGGPVWRTCRGYPSFFSLGALP